METSSGDTVRSLRGGHVPAAGRPTLSDLPPPPAGRQGWPWTAWNNDFAESLDEAADQAGHWPKITVVTPCFNQAGFLEETLRSVLLQDYPHVEYFVIDGGSTDGSVDVIRRYEKWLDYWVSERDRGQSDAINKGWRRATGEIVCWLNGDDLFFPDTLSRVARAWRRNPEAHMWYGRCEYFTGETVLQIVGRPYDVVSSIANGQVADVGQAAVFAARKAVMAVGAVDVRLRQAMDKDLWQRLAATGPIQFVPEVWARFRVHPDQMTERNAADPRFSGALERLIGFQNLFALDGLRPEIRSQKHACLSMAYAKAALDCRAKGRIGMALKLSAMGLLNRGWRKWSCMTTLASAIAGPSVTAMGCRLLRLVRRRPLKSAVSGG